MKKRGLTGRVKFFWAGVPYPGLIVRDLGQGADLCVIEEDRRGPALEEWQPPKMCRHPGQLRPLDEVSGPSPSQTRTVTKPRRSEGFSLLSRRGTPLTQALTGRPS